MPITGDSRMTEVEQAFPIVRLALLFRFHIRKYEPGQALAEVLSAHAVTDWTDAVNYLRSIHDELQRDFATGRMEVWRGPLNRFLRQYCVEIAIMSARMTTPQGSTCSPLLLASQRAVDQRGGCSVVDASYTIRSQMERISFERWLEGERVGHRLSNDEERAVVLRWHQQYSDAHKNWLNLQLQYFLLREWEPFFKHIFADNPVS